MSAFVKNLATFKGLKRRGRFTIRESDIDPGIREFCRKINKLPYLAVTGSCEGYTYEELLERGWSPTEIKKGLDGIHPLFPRGYSPAYIDMYVLADRRFELWKWLKENVGLDKVDIRQTPMEGGEGYSEFTYLQETPTYVRDKLFHVGIKSKSLRMPFKGGSTKSVNHLSRGSAIPDAVRMEMLQSKREGERVARKDWKKIKKIYPELKYEDAAIITPTAVKMKDGKIYRLKGER